MIVADIYPVFCPRVVVPSNNPWSRCTTRPDLSCKKMWPDASTSGRFDESRRLLSSLRVPIPGRSLPSRESPFKMAFPDSLYKSRPMESFRSLASTSSIFKSSPFIGNADKTGRPSISYLPTERVLSSTSTGLSPGASFASPTIPSEISTNHCTLQQKLPFKREHDGRQGERYFHDVKRQCHQDHVRTREVCTPKNLALFRSKGNGVVTKKVYTCPQCKYVTDRKNNLKRHISTMHQDCSKVLECCGLVFRSKALLRDHVSLFHRAGYRCQYCGRNFCRKALLRRHLSVHSGQKDFTCPQCGYATSHKSNLERHRKIHDRKFSLNDEVISDDAESVDEQGLSRYVEMLATPPRSLQSPRNLQSPRSLESSSSLSTSEPKQENTHEDASFFSRVRRSVLFDSQREEHPPFLSESTAVSSKPPITSPNYTQATAIQTKTETCSTRPGLIEREIPEFFSRTPSFLTSNSKEAYNDRKEQPETDSAVLELKSDGREIKTCRRYFSNRLFLTPYKCCDCLAVFSKQRDLSQHICNAKKQTILSPPISVTEKKARFFKKLHAKYPSTLAGSNLSEVSEMSLLSVPESDCSEISKKGFLCVSSERSQHRTESLTHPSVGTDSPKCERKDCTSLPLKKRTLDDVER